MFKFLRKAMAALEPKEDVAVIIERIHNEFDNATERLLNEAKEIIAKGDKIKTEKANRLKRLGFTQSKDVTDTQEQIKKENESKELSDAIVYYQQWYPNNKFITENEVKKICQKYNLVCGEVVYYKGDVPEKNLAEMEAFNLRKEDMQQEYSYHQTIDQWLGARRNSIDDLYQRQYMALAQSQPKYEAKPTGEYVKPGFKICAPKDDFDTSSMIVSKNYILQHIPDPIVLQPVKHGYLIVSKWGLEANDEIVQNPKHN